MPPAYDSVVTFTLPATLKHSAIGPAADVTDVPTPIGIFKVYVVNDYGRSKSVDFSIIFGTTVSSATGSEMR